MNAKNKKNSKKVSEILINKVAEKTTQAENKTAKFSFIADKNFKDLRGFSAIAKTFKPEKISTIIKETVVNPEIKGKRVIVLASKVIEKSFKKRFDILLDVCNTEKGKQALKDTNTDIKEISIPNLMNCYTNLIIGDKKQFYKIVRLKEDKSNLFTFEHLANEFGTFDQNSTFVPCTNTADLKIDFSILDSKFELITDNDSGCFILETKNEEKYTFEKLESLSFNAILSKIISLRKFKNIQAAKAIDKKLREKQAAKKETAKKETAKKESLPDFSTFTAKQFIEWQKAQKAA